MAVLLFPKDDYRQHRHGYLIPFEFYHLACACRHAPQHSTAMQKAEQPLSDRQGNSYLKIPLQVALFLLTFFTAWNFKSAISAPYPANLRCSISLVRELAASRNSPRGRVPTGLRWETGASGATR